MKNLLKQAAIEITGTALSLTTTQDATASKQAVKNAAEGISAFMHEKKGIVSSTIAGTVLSATGNMSAQDGVMTAKAVITQAKQKFTK